MKKDFKFLILLLIIMVLGISITYRTILSGKLNKVQTEKDQPRANLKVSETPSQVDTTAPGKITPRAYSPAPEPSISISPSISPSISGKRKGIEIEPDIILTEEDFKIYPEKDQKQILVGQPTGEYYKMVAKLVNAKPGEVIADIGCGTGPLPFILSPVVGKKGRIIAVDTQDETLRYQLNKMRKLAKRYKGIWDFNNITMHLNDQNDILLEKNLIDKAVMSGVHIFNYDPERTSGKDPRKDKNGNILKEQIIDDIVNPKDPKRYDHASFGKSLYNSIKPNGKLYLLEWIYTNQWALGEKEVPKVLEAFGFEFEKYDNKSIDGCAIWVFVKKIKK